MANPSQRPGVVLAVLSLAAFMASLDVFIVNVAFDAIGADFPGSTLSQLSWVLNGYAIVYAALLVPAGRIADRYGRKGGFLIGLAVFTAASAACAASEGIWWLVGFRVLQAAGAALLTPASLGLVIAAAPPEHRARAVRVWAATGALAAALGPAVGGVLVEASWRWVFLVNVPIGVVALLAAAAWVPRSRDESVTKIPDVRGALLLAVAIGALTLALVEGPSWGWGSGRLGLAWAVAAAGLVGFVLSSRRHDAPIIEPALLRVRAFAWSNATALLFAVPFAAALLTNILWMQQVWHYSAIRTGFAIAPGPLMVPVFAAIAHRLATRIPIGWIVAAGCVLVGAGGVTTSLLVGATPNYAGSVLPGWLIGGVGVGLALPAILSSATADLPPARAATGSAIVNMNRQIGTALGVSVVIAVLGTPIGYAAAHAAFQHTWWTAAGVAILAAVAAPAMTPRAPLTGGQAAEVAQPPATARMASPHR
ncbi:DHA2 family efflux MFS transporter permease subunit [uncultured Jatrophihabitans sp.]|uniref:DHA2 family efflux MFS transporter permease subunit n=1 Tax=uncultured Jatrophihabitans sp. TaxID=1610747 RepID=UPI0035CB2540